MGTYANRRKRQLEAKQLNANGIMVGETYGNYKILEKIKVPCKVSRGNGVYVECLATRWKCLYIPDQTIKITTTGYLSEFKTPEQVQDDLNALVKANKHQKGYRSYLYRTYLAGAKNRNHDFNLSKEEFELIIQKNCFYCGLPPQPTSEGLLKQRGNTKEPPFYYNGIDRIDSNKGYSVDNCVPCCSCCNYMKHTLSQKDFLEKVKTIYRYLIESSETIENTSIPDGSELSTLQANGSGNGELLPGKAEDEDIVQSIL